MQNKKTLKESHLEVATDLNALSQVLEWFEETATSLLPDKAYWQCKLALAEGFTNAVRHAHQGLPKTTPIKLEVKFFTQYLEMKVWDRGQPFDLLARLQYQTKLQSNFDPKKDDVPEGGRGLIWMNQLTDELSYTRTPDQQNCLFMRKKFRRIRRR
ncbi:MAG: ATP-binding protein [Spirulinaceae cyanobacterium]